MQVQILLMLWYNLWSSEFVWLYNWWAIRIIARFVSFLGFLQKLLFFSLQTATKTNQIDSHTFFVRLFRNFHARHFGYSIRIEELWNKRKFEQKKKWAEISFEIISNYFDLALSFLPRHPWPYTIERMKFIHPCGNSSSTWTIFQPSRAIQNVYVIYIYISIYLSI